MGRRLATFRREVEGRNHGASVAGCRLIRKGKAAKPNEFGKMVMMQEAENQIVVDYVV
jgi:IS5 family transposase